jgi:hypothetical protein
MPIPKINPAKRRYLIRFSSTMGAYVIAVFAVVHYLIRSHPTGPTLYLLAVLPSLPIIGSIVVVGLYIAEEKDEFQRQLIEWSLLWAIGGTLAATSVWGFLEMFANARHLTPFYVFPLFWICTAIAGTGLRIRYGSCND